MTTRLFLVDENLTYDDFVELVKTIYGQQKFETESKLDISIAGKVHVYAEITNNGYSVKKRNEFDA